MFLGLRKNLRFAFRQKSMRAVGEVKPDFSGQNWFLEEQEMPKKAVPHLRVQRKPENRLNARGGFPKFCGGWAKVNLSQQQSLRLKRSHGLQVQANFLRIRNLQGGKTARLARKDLPAKSVLLHW